MKIKKINKTKQEQKPIHISGQSLSVVFHFFPQSLASLSVRRLSQELRGGEMVVVAFSSLARILENVRQFIPRLHFFFFKVETSSRAVIPLFRPESVQSGPASRDELRVSSFPYRFPHYTWTALGQRRMHV